MVQMITIIAIFVGVFIIISITGGFPIRRAESVEEFRTRLLKKAIRMAYRRWGSFLKQGMTATAAEEMRRIIKMEQQLVDKDWRNH